MNEYSKAKQTGDDTGGAQAEAEKSLKKAYAEVGFVRCFTVSKFKMSSFQTLPRN